MRVQGSLFTRCADVITEAYHVVGSDGTALNIPSDLKYAHTITYWHQAAKFAGEELKQKNLLALGRAAAQAKPSHATTQPQVQPSFPFNLLTLTTL